jgi:hypothetical protein
VGHDASRGFNDFRDSIISRTRSLSLTTTAPQSSSHQATKEAADKAETTPTAAKDMSSEDAINESENVLSRLRTEASKRLKDIQKAEDAADEALLRFGSNLRDFLRDAIKIAPPTAGASQGSTVLFESKDAQGKRVIHTSRFDAQLHVIHTSLDSFTKDPTGDEYEAWSSSFDIDNRTSDISNDLSTYPELRTSMEKLVPDQIAYADFWKRYYFLRHGIETAEARRRDLLKGTTPSSCAHGLLTWTHTDWTWQRPRPGRKLAGTRTRTMRAGPARLLPRRIGLVQPNRRPQSTRPPSRLCSSPRSLENQTTKSRRPTAMPATT